MTEENKTIAVVRIRGRVNVNKKIENTMQLMKLDKTNTCTIIPYNKYYKGMLQKIKDYVTYGEVSKETFKKMLLKWGRVEGNKRVTEDYLKSKGITIDDLFSFKKRLKEAGVKIPFRLHPPRKGFKATRKPFTMKGDLGYRGEAINELIEKMT